MRNDRLSSRKLVLQCFLLVLFLLFLASSGNQDDSSFRNENDGNGKNNKGNGSNSKQNSVSRPKDYDSRPNFVIVLTDDLDWTLGGTNASTLAKTRHLLGGEENGYGKTIPDWFAQTPMCCCSRSELLTGRLFHNLKVSHFDDPGCAHIDVNSSDPEHSFWRDRYFANFFKPRGSCGGTNNNNNNNNNNNSTTKNRSQELDIDYKVGIFGKHLNPPHNPTTFIPPGVDEMLINGGGTYLNPTFTHGTRKRKRRERNSNGHENEYSNECNKRYNPNDDYDQHIEQVHFDNCTNATGMPCYSTSVIGNASLAWIRRQVQHTQGSAEDNYLHDDDRDDRDANTATVATTNPFLAVISTKAPHIQDGNGFPMPIPAPWYNETLLPEQIAPRTPNYNYTTQGHHWVVRTQPPLTTLEAAKVDELYVSRLKTLLSVDDLVQDLVNELEELNVLDNTYILFTSDHGYRLGQFKIPQCKLHPYENDVRVPMLIRGPGVGDHKKDPPRQPRRSIPTNSRDYAHSRALFSHVHIMPTLLGLATGQHYSQDIVPNTMDGTNLAGWLLETVGGNDRDHDHDHHEGNPMEYEKPLSSDSSSSSSSTTTTTTTTSSPSFVSLLIEYTSIGNVVRYQHLVDTFNHTFVALRIMPVDQHVDPEPSSNRSNIDFQHTKSKNNTSASTPIVEHISNLKYIEFRDSRVDWTNTGPPLERELYDLDKDPFELDNLLAPKRRVSPSLLLALETKIDRLIACSGEDCRREHSTGLERLLDGPLLSGK